MGYRLGRLTGSVYEQRDSYTELSIYPGAPTNYGATNPPDPDSGSPDPNGQLLSTRTSQVTNVTALNVTQTVASIATIVLRIGFCRVQLQIALGD